MKSDEEYLIQDDENGFGRCFILKGAWNEAYIDLMSANGIAVLRLSEPAGWVRSDLSFLRNIQFLTGIELIGQSIVDISPIFEIKSLRYVAIQCEFKSAVDFRGLGKLEVCKLFWKPGVVGLNACLGLRHLNIVGYPFENLTEFSLLINLVRIQISSRKMTSLKGVEMLDSLQTLDLMNCPKLSDLNSVTDCKNLRLLVIQGCRNIHAMPPDMIMNNLEEMHLIDCGSIGSLALLSNCKSLKTLIFTGDTNIVDGDIAALLKLSSIREVRFANRRHYNLTREELSLRLETQFKS